MSESTRDPGKRPRYFNNQFLMVDDFRDENFYHRDKQQRHERLLHVGGIVEGLEISAVSGGGLKVSQGSAIDPDGRQILLTQPRILEATGLAGRLQGRSQLFISFHEDETDEAPGGDDGSVKGFTRYTQKPEIALVLYGSTPPAGGVFLAELDIGADGVVSNLNFDERVYSGLRLPGPEGSGPSLRSGGDRAPRTAVLSGHLSVTGELAAAGLSVTGELAAASLSVAGTAKMGRLSVPAGGSVGIGTEAPLRKLHIRGKCAGPSLCDGNDRPGILLSGDYPDFTLFSRVNNPSHGPTIRLGAYDGDSEDSKFKHWSIGTAGRNAGFLDIGFAANQTNPHAGIRDYPPGDTNTKTVITLTHEGSVGINTLAPSVALEVNGDAKISAGLEVAGTTRLKSNLEIEGRTSTGDLHVEGVARLGFAAEAPDFAAPLNSGFYAHRDDQSSAATGLPDTSHGWTHLLTVRHQSLENNHQLQIAASYSANDRLFFRKLADSDQVQRGGAWHEVATRGPNTFSGSQTVSAQSTHLTLNRPESETSGGKYVALELVQRDAEKPSIPETWPSIRFHHACRYWHRIEAQQTGLHFKTGDLGSDDYVPMFAGALSAANLGAIFEQGTRWDNAYQGPDGPWLEVVSKSLHLEVPTNVAIIGQGHGMTADSAYRLSVAVFVDGQPAQPGLLPGLPFGIGITHHTIWTPIFTVRQVTLEPGRHTISLKYQPGGPARVDFNAPCLMIMLLGTPK